MSAVIQARNLNKRYRNTQALRDVSFEVGAGRLNVTECIDDLLRRIDQPRSRGLCQLPWQADVPTDLLRAARLAADWEEVPERRRP